MKLKKLKIFLFFLTPKNMQNKIVASIFNRKTLKQAMILFMVIAIGLVAFASIPAYAIPVSEEDRPTNIEEIAPSTNVRELARLIVNFFLFFLGLVATIMVIYGGVLYVTAAGNDEQAGKAKNVILYAVAGIIVILLSFALVNTVILGAGTGEEPTGV